MELETFVRTAVVEAHEGRFVVVGGMVAGLAGLVEVSIEVVVVKALGQAVIVSVLVDTHLTSLRRSAYSQVVNYIPRLDIVVGEVVVAYYQAFLQMSLFAFGLDLYWKEG